MQAPKGSDMPKEADRQVAATRAAFEGGTLYPTASICATAGRESLEYTERLLYEKLDTIRRYNRGGLLVDLCCATGGHIPEVRQRGQYAVGLDFSLPFLRQAIQKNQQAGFVAADARKLPLATASIGLLYSLSALYLVPNFDQTIAEVSRVLRPGGRCVLDLGNQHSLNSYCVRHHYPELPASYHMPVSKMIRLCRENGLHVVEHRVFQLLPLWAGKPRWLWPLLHPFWRRLMAKRLAGRMLDEWVSGNRLLRRLAFRHLLVCEKMVDQSNSNDR
jgi:ubiquinone/menaquinone biosynthesis C-methylase UbiE